MNEELKKTTYYSECECGHTLEGEGDYDPTDGTLYGQACEGCGQEFTVWNWFEQCEECEEYHGEGEDCGFENA